MYFKFALGVYLRYLLFLLLIIFVHSFILEYQSGAFYLSFLVRKIVGYSLFFFILGVIPSLLGLLVFYLFLSRSLYETDINNDKMERLIQILKLNFYSHLLFWSLVYLPWQMIIDNTPHSDFFIFAFIQFTISCFAVVWQNTVTPNNSH